jgi:hypothetical protein
MMPRSKPFKYTYEKELVMYAYFKKLDYFSTECIYSPKASQQFQKTSGCLDSESFIVSLFDLSPYKYLKSVYQGYMTETIVALILR